MQALHHPLRAGQTVGRRFRQCTASQLEFWQLEYLCTICCQTPEFQKQSQSALVPFFQLDSHAHTPCKWSFCWVFDSRVVAIGRSSVCGRSWQNLGSNSDTLAWLGICLLRDQRQAQQTPCSMKRRLSALTNQAYTEFVPPEGSSPPCTCPRLVGLFGFVNM